MGMLGNLLDLDVKEGNLVARRGIRGLWQSTCLHLPPSCSKIQTKRSRSCSLMMSWGAATTENCDTDFRGYSAFVCCTVS